MPKGKPLKDLDPVKAGVSLAVLTKAFDTLDLLEAELAEEDAKVADGLVKKKKAQAAYDKAKDDMRALLHVRDAVQEEWQQASWIVRNADPDQPPPPLGNRVPGIKTPRS